MSMYQNLTDMMMIPGNREIWEKYLRSHFMPAKAEDSYESIIEYLTMERDLIAAESAWSERDKSKRLFICIKVKLLPR